MFAAALPLDWRSKVSNLPKLSLTKRVRVVRWICRRHDRSCAGFLRDASPVDPRVGPVLFTAIFHVGLLWLLFLRRPDGEHWHDITAERVVYNDLVGAMHDAFHGFQVHALARYLRRFPVLLIDA